MDAPDRTARHPASEPDAPGLWDLLDLSYTGEGENNGGGMAPPLLFGAIGLPAAIARLTAVAAISAGPAIFLRTCFINGE